MNKDAWYQYFTECEAVTDRNAELVEEKFKECEAYTEKVLKKKYPECGVVFTGHAEAIKAGYFTIWIDTGSLIQILSARPMRLRYSSSTLTHW